MTNNEILLSILSAIGLIAPIIAAFIDSDIEGRKFNKRFLWLFLPAATTWIWVPWFMLACTTIGRKNSALVHDLGKPEIVQPAADITRPSKADNP